MNDQSTPTPDQNDPDYMDYLISTGNADMIGQNWTDCCSRMVMAGFDRWKKDRDYEKREAEMKKAVDKQTSGM